MPRPLVLSKAKDLLFFTLIRPTFVRSVPDRLGFMWHSPVDARSSALSTQRAACRAIIPA